MWNFFEASYDKGPPDGLGGAYKRSADQIVAYGGAIPDTQSL